MAEQRSARWWRIGLFVLLYTAAHAAYRALREHGGSHWLVDTATALPAAALIDLLFPADAVQAAGPRLVWPGGRLQLLAGCDGFEVMALYVPAVLVAPVGWRRGLVMLGGGLLLIWALNQARLLGLYLAFRHWREGFDALHMLWGPLLLLGAVAGFFAWQLRADSRA